ncbi:MAG TPA: IPT/TIG domain-containing protein [Pseudonocardiaceae bacterium]|nr:IPT/TIG domain-containing protein [Pseudonocardiaceae bacterium]
MSGAVQARAEHTPQEGILRVPIPSPLSTRRGLLSRLAALIGATALSVAGLVALATPAQAADFEITSISPTSGPTSGGTTVTITGNSFQEGFCSTFTVTFGGVGASFTINSNTSMTATAPAHSAGTVDIRATNVCDDDFPDTPNTSADDYTYVDSGADLAASLADSADPVALGDTFTDTLTVTNNGSATATGTTASITMSGASAGILAASPSQGSCSISAPTVSCTLGTLANSAAATVTLTLSPTATGTVTASASVDADQTDPTSGNDTDAENTTVNNAHGCTITGTNGNDDGVSNAALTGTNGNDVICGLAGDDVINGGNGNDTIYAGPGDDDSYGEDLLANLFAWLFDNGNDTIYGGPGDDDLDGQNGNDTLTDTNGTDIMSGSNGTDTINVQDGTGGDTANGGNGNDTCTTDTGDTTISC